MPIPLVAVGCICMVKTGAVMGNYSLKNYDPNREIHCFFLAPPPFPACLLMKSTPTPILPSSLLCICPDWPGVEFNTPRHSTHHTLQRYRTGSFHYPSGPVVQRITHAIALRLQHSQHSSSHPCLLASNLALARCLSHTLTPRPLHSLSLHILPWLRAAGSAYDRKERTLPGTDGRPVEPVMHPLPSMPLLLRPRNKSCYATLALNCPPMLLCSACH